MSIKPKPELLHLFERMKNDDNTLVAWDNLPIFSEIPIDDTYGIFSWDDNFKIEGTCSADIEILLRDETTLFEVVFQGTNQGGTI